MLMSAGGGTPEKLFGHGFIDEEGLKMGKGLGNTLDSKALVGTYGADVGGGSLFFEGCGLCT